MWGPHLGFDQFYWVMGFITIYFGAKICYVVWRKISRGEQLRKSWFDYPRFR